MTALVAHEGQALLDESRAVLRKHGRSFAWAAPFLPRAARADAALVYAFCRLVDDTADEASSPEVARVGLQLLEDEVRGVKRARPIVRAYLEVARRRSISFSAVRGLLDGALSDVCERVVLADDEALDRYCFQVAGTVGVMMHGILEAEGERARDPAVALGVGMQLTNICRDVTEDAGRLRVYLPSTLLAACGTDAAAVLARREDARPAIVAAVRVLLERADERYARAAEGLVFLPWRARLGVAVALRLYRSIGVEVLRLGERALDVRAVVPVWRKALEVVRGVALALSASRTRAPVRARER